ncbi:peptidylprolyl isomerase [Chelatococcus sp. SYSU_G07232]|uniref:Parvulin-like PPIase n=1 Tax=Chelatococcus albus TaxID=3047466 RepID=A0ABT7AMA1_9HYPH|nr:peptidylprolyl isomerase [Chelatococcus sp. SYSU_G07232]MDJ1159924.1 peptidylprolyl isomerase [Chelatococcus sp. SYSU_G07232]
MGCSIRTPNLDAGQARVSVNGVAIERAAIAREVQHHPAPSPTAAWKRAAQALVVRELLLQEARRLGLAPAPRTDAAGRRETDEEALIRALVEREVVTPVPDEETCRRYYEQNRHRFRSPDICEAAHILFAARRDDAEAFAAARAQAEAVLALLRERPGAFAELARIHSACPSAAQGGNLGQITPGETTPEFEAALVALAPGELTPEPVVTRYGVHIIRLAQRHPGRELPFALVHARIAAYLAVAVEQRAMAQYVGVLAGRATITGVEMGAAAGPLVQ